MIYSGLTWDHPRGYDALAAAAAKTAAGRPVVQWSKQPLERFESHPIADLAGRYDLLVIDHPHIGEAVAAGCLRTLESLFPEADIKAWEEQSIGPSMASYEWGGAHFALPLDVATQVMAFRSDLVGERPVTWDDVIKLAEHLPVAPSISGPHAICSFFSLCVALGEEPGGDDLVSKETAEEALTILTELAAGAPSGTQTMNPIALLETMSRSDEIALVPLVYGYVNYARSSSRRHIVSFGDAPVAKPGGRPGSVLGGTGIAITWRAMPDEALLDHLRWLMSIDAQSRFIPEHEGQPSARGAWLSDTVNAAAGNFYRATSRTVEQAWVRPRHNGYIVFQSEGSAIIRDAILDRQSHNITIENVRAAWRRSLAPTMGQEQ